MANSLDREVKKIQFRIQQEISLADDEIQRMSEQLNEYKSEIVRKEKQSERLAREIAAIEEKMQGTVKRAKVSRSTHMANVINAHHLLIQHIKQQQEEEVIRLQEQFGEQLETFENMTNAHIERNYNQIQNEINDLRNEINRNSIALSRKATQTNYAAKEAAAHCGMINNTLVMKLRSIADEKSRERVTMLQNSKQKLLECVDHMEEMEKEHAVDVADRRKTIEHVDKAYERELNKLNQAHRHKIMMLKGHLTEAVKRLQILRKAASKLEEANEHQLRETMKEIDNLHVPDYSADRLTLKEEKSRGEDLNCMKTDLKMRLRAKENELEDVRSKNSALRKEIASWVHYIRFSVRRVQVETRSV